MGYDVIVVGAGSAGAVVATRLADRGRSVLLLEAGPDFGWEAQGQPAAIRDAFDLSATEFDWDHSGTVGQSPRRVPLYAGRVIGGSSATNNVMALRGHPDDYDGWARLHTRGWSFEEVLPYFRRAENDTDHLDNCVDSDRSDGPGLTPIRRFGTATMAPVHKSFVAACVAAGFPAVPNHNGRGAHGVGPIPMNQVDGVRQSTALTYLAAARQLTNLTVWAHAEVDRVDLHHGRATGVRLARSGETIAANEIILCAGTYGSPQLLMRSGIGPARSLRELRIEVRQDLVGVGANLQDHPLLHVPFLARGPVGKPGTPLLQTLLTCSSRAGIYDLHIFPVGLMGDRATPVLVLAVSVVHPISKGYVRLRSDRFDDRPLIQAPLLTHPDDMEAMVRGVELTCQVAATSPLADLIVAPLWPGLSLMKGTGLAAAIRSAVRSYQHPVGTCHMGDADSSVVDSGGAVHGVERLFVVDASIMPVIPRANTNLPTLMVAERCADLIGGSQAARWASNSAVTHAG